MATWATISFKFSIFDPLKPPLQIFLGLLETIEAILEALLAIIKAFLIDLTNPFSAIINALIAALRAIINQIESSGLSVLPVLPDFSQPDFGSILASVSGSFAGFESRVASKFHDTSDLFRPQYAPGSSVAMLVFYLGFDDPSQLFSAIMGLNSLFGQHFDISLPAPVGVKIGPINKSGNKIGQFRALFSSDLDKALSIEWRMPEAPSGEGLAGVVNQSVQLFNSFRFPDFIIERTGPFPQDKGPELSTSGDIVQLDIESSTMGPQPNKLIQRYGMTPVSAKAIVTEGPNGKPFRLFPKKFVVSGENLVQGALTGSYAVTDEDPDLVAGKVYYYRIRAYFGDATKYLIASSQALVKASAKKWDNRVYLDFSPGMIGAPSVVVPGFVPRAALATTTFDPYYNILDAVRVGLLLNFEFPPTYPTDSGIQNTAFRNQQRTGWGTLSLLGGQIGQLKAAFTTSDKLNDNYLFTIKARHISNMALTQVYNNPKVLDSLSDKWNTNVKNIVQRFYFSALGGGGVTFATPAVPWGKQWSFIGIVGGMTSSSAQKIDSYLGREESYKVSDLAWSGPVPLSPTLGSTYCTLQERLDLADFLRSAINAAGLQASYLSWQTITIGELFPALLPFMFEFEQFLLSLLRAVNSALQAIVEIIETLLQKVQALKQIVQTILNLLNIMDISVSASVLAVSGSGSADTLLEQFLSSEGKPESSPNGIYSGIVMTAGGPGPGFVAAINAIKFLLTAGQG